MTDAEWQSPTREYARTHRSLVHPLLKAAIEAVREQAEDGRWALAVAEAFDLGWKAGEEANRARYQARIVALEAALYHASIDVHHLAQHDGRTLGCQRKVCAETVTLLAQEVPDDPA